jgi:TldD protein
MDSSRRTFLKRMSQATALGMVGTTVVPRHLMGLNANEAALRLGLLEGDEELMRQMANWALDAAKAAGAVFADVRVSFGRSMMLQTYKDRAKIGSSGPMMGSGASIGIRAVTDGVWGFAGESTLTQDGIVALAKLAVARAKAARPLKAKSFEYVNAPQVPDGRWMSPYEVDPTTVQFKDLEAYQLDAHEDINKIAGLVSHSGLSAYGKNDMVFASSEGSMIVQRIITCGIGGSASTKSKKDPERWVGAGTDIPSGQYGYEAISKSNLKAEWHKAADEAFRLAELPWKSVEVGRFPIVMGADAMANFVMASIAGAVMLNRARGDLANGAGTSYAAPPADILGKYKVGSPTLTVNADRTRQRAWATTGYDADGVKAEEWTIVKDGIIVDYLTTRDTAGTIADWYQSKGQQVRSHGCSVGGGMGQPGLGFSNLTIQAAKGAAKAEDLYKELKHGFYAPSGGAGGDQQLINFAGYFGDVFEVVNGKIVGFAADFGIQFNTQQFWTKLDAVGGPESAELIQIVPPGLGVYAVPGRIKEVSVINTGKES